MISLKKNFPGNKISLLILLLLLVFIGVERFFIYPPKNVLTWDVFAYYLYLPAKFIYHDLDLLNNGWIDNIFSTYHPSDTFYQAFTGPKDVKVITVTVSLAMLYAPFFLLAHGYALAFGYPADGFSMPYQYGIAIGAFIYTIVGLYFFRKVLLHFFSDKLSGLLLILTVLGTNYINQATGSNITPHNILFSLFAILVWYVIRWHEAQKIRYMVFIGLLMGMITLIRPTEIVCILVPLLWGVYEKKSLTKKLNLINKHKYQILLAIFCFALVIMPQLIYWKRQTGSFVFYSYTNPNEGLDLLSPHVGNFLLSFRKGWLIYTPLAFFFIIGLIPLYKNQRKVFYAVTVFFVLSLYLISSWSCWWYAGGCYSQRAMTTSYVLLALPLGYFIKWAGKKIYLLIPFMLVLGFLVMLNLFQWWQFYNGILKGYTMTKKYYCAIFGKTSIPEGAENLLMVNRSFTMNETMPDPANFNKKILGYYDFSNPNSTYSNLVKDIRDTNTYCLAMDSTAQYSPGLYIKFKNITGEYYAWIKAHAEFLVPENYNEPLPLLVVTFIHDKKCYKYLTKELKSDNDTSGVWQKSFVDYLTPEVRDKEDTLQVYLWHRGKKPVYIKNLLVEAYDPIDPQ